MVLARTVLILLQPPACLFILALMGGLLIRWQYRRAGGTLVAAAVVLLYLLSTPAVSNLLIRPLEDDFPPMKASIKGVDAVVVLTSGVMDLGHLGLEPEPGSGSLKRLAHGIKLYRQMQGVPLVICGGRADPARPDLSFGEVLGREAMALGVPEKDIVIEDDSVNTYQGALNLRKMLKGKKVVLVTSAFHMGRAFRLYQRAGFLVVPAPTNFIGQSIPLHINSVLPSAGALGVSSLSFYEYLSRLWYIVKGPVPADA
jgi:uncharacterized SAM-binding protein YcdF (DUF218 family)